MWVWVDRLGVLAFDAGLSATLLWAGAWLLTLGSRQPARRLRIARAAAVGSIVVLPLSALRPLPRVDLFRALRSAGALPHPLQTPRSLLISSTGGRIEKGDELAKPGPPLSLGLWPSRALTLGYVAGVAAGLGWLTLGWGALGWITRRSVAPSPGTLALLASLPFSRPGRRPRLRVADRLGRPALVGFIRPLILIPAGLDLPENRDRLRLSLLHELAHAEGFDPLFGLLGGLSRALWFFAPPVWWLAAQARLDQEFLADRRASDGYGSASEYAACLIQFVSDRARGPDDPAEAASSWGAGEASPLYQRVLMLLRSPFTVEARPPAWWSRGLSALILLATLTLSSLSIRRPADLPTSLRRERTFFASRLHVPATLIPPRGRSPDFELPVRLPGEFELSVEVWGDRNDLARTRVVGLTLADPPPLDLSEAPAWHTVHIRRDAERVSQQLDGERVPVPTQGPALTPWLSVEPAPSLPLFCRHIRLSWRQ